MHNLSEFLVFSLACWALILSPGPDMIYVITRGVSQGRMAGVLSAIGVIGGILVHTLFAACGLSVILQTSAMAFMAVKLAGAAYLVYLGIKTLLSKEMFRLDCPGQTASNRRVFMQGVMSNVLNPKVAVFFLAFLPQFVDPGQHGAALSMALLGLTFTGFCLMFLLPLGWFAGRVGAWLLARPAIASKLKYLTGTVMVGLGLRLAVGQRS